MQNVELRAVALGKKLRSVALEHGFGLNEAGFIVHEALLHILLDDPDAARPAPDPKGAQQRIEVTSAPSAWRGR